MKTRKLKLFIILLSLLGAAFAGFSLYEHTILEAGLTTGPSLCNIGEEFNCDVVNASPYSKLFGLPLAGFGLVYYILLLLSAFTLKSEESSVHFRKVFFAASVGTILFSMYLFYISKFVIGTICLFCLGMYVINGLLLLVSFRAVQPNAPQSTIRGALIEGVCSIAAAPLRLVVGPDRATAMSYTIIIFCVLCLVFISPTLIKKYAHPSVKKGAVSVQQLKQRAMLLENWLKLPVEVVLVTFEENSQQDYFKGNPQAPIMIVEFSDFECPACRFFYPKMENLLKEYEGKVRFVAKNFPLDQRCNSSIPMPMHKKSCFAADFVMCAGEQGRFWDAYDYVFTSDIIEDEKSTLEQTEPVLLSAAQSMNMDDSAIRECMKSGRKMEKIKSDIAEGITLKLKGTPAIFIDGRPVATGEVEEILAALVSAQSFPTVVP